MPLSHEHLSRVTGLHQPLGNALSPNGPAEFERDIAQLIVETLNLEMRPEEIRPDAALFGEGLGLDSIDALELALTISRTYGLDLKSDEGRNREIFGSLRNLAAYIAEHRTK